MTITYQNPVNGETIEDVEAYLARFGSVSEAPLKTRGRVSTTGAVEVCVRLRQPNDLGLKVIYGVGMNRDAAYRDAGRQVALNSDY